MAGGRGFVGSFAMLHEQLNCIPLGVAVNRIASQHQRHLGVQMLLSRR